MKKKYVLGFRPIRYMFKGNWYSLYRWKRPTEILERNYRLIDIGAITIGYYTVVMKENK